MTPETMRALTVLGIETSCDETAAAVVRREPDGRGEILSDIVLSQTEEHAAFGGVVPEIAARAHVEALDEVIRAAMAKAETTWRDLDAIAVTAGPGLIGGLLVGTMTARALSAARKIPLLPLNHLEGHALTATLTDRVRFPLSAAPRLRRAHAARWQSKASAAIAGSARRSTTRSARRSTRPPSSSASPIPADRTSNAPPRPATRSAFLCRGR